MIRIQTAYQHIKQVKDLFAEYVNTELKEYDLVFQHFDKEFDDPATTYAPPKGRLYIALVDDNPAGCIGMYPHDQQQCVLKRLYVKPQFRNMHIANMLVTQIIQDATSIGYQAILLDTAEKFNAAIQLYTKLGFKEVNPFYHNPYQDVKYFQLKLN
jgi:ribosomal protein S18 acetylase RimI-like enzyme